jgi:hypothetical protein
MALTVWERTANFVCVSEVIGRNCGELQIRVRGQHPRISGFPRVNFAIRIIHERLIERLILGRSLQTAWR